MGLTMVLMVLYGWAAMALLQLGLYLIQRARRDAGIVDAGWAFGLAVLALWYAWNGTGDPSRRLLVALLGGVWGLRLSAYLFLDRVLPPGEDGRYQMLRERWGDRAQLWFFLFFQVQAFWSVLFSIPFLAVTSNASPLGPWDILGTVIWLVAVGGESVADRQLARWRSRPENHGKTCREGLWRLSRHPNYFFEWIHWWAYVCLSIGTPWVWAALAGPVAMLLFLYKITGIPYTEARALASRGEDYARYQRSTSAFVPWFPRKESP